MSKTEQKGEAALQEAAVEVTEEMTEAGFRVLVRSGMKPWDEYLESDKLWLEEIYRAMFVLAPHPSQQRASEHGP